MCASDLEALYRATETDLSYALGVLALPELGVVPVLQIFYATWTREMLTAIQAPLARGLELVSSVASDGTSELHLSTREQVALRVTQAGQTFVWQAPAWEAHLTGGHRQPGPVRGRVPPMRPVLAGAPDAGLDVLRPGPVSGGDHAGRGDRTLQLAVKRTRCPTPVEHPVLFNQSKAGPAPLSVPGRLLAMEVSR